MNDDLLRGDDLVDNPAARVPVCLCLDTSGSMNGARINELNQGVHLFYDAIRSDEIAQYSAEISVITFGSVAQCITDFSSLLTQPNPPMLSANGMTPMGEAVNMALDALDRRKEEYSRKGVDYYQPWLVLMTDGEPNGSESELTRAENRTVELVNRRKLTVFPIGIGNDADMRTLNRFSPGRPALKLQGLKFKEFFAWLSQSVKMTSQSSPGETIKIDVEAINGWSEIPL